MFGLEQPRPRAFKPGVGGSPPAGPFAADFKQLVDRNDCVVVALPQPVAAFRTARVIIRGYLGGRIRDGEVRKFARDDGLRGGNIDVAFGGRQIPVVGEREPAGLEQGQLFWHLDR